MVLVPALQSPCTQRSQSPGTKAQAHPFPLFYTLHPAPPLGEETEAWLCIQVALQLLRSFFLGCKSLF